MGKRQLKTKDNSTKKAKKAETLPSTQSDEVAAGDELDLAEVIAMGGSKEDFDWLTGNEDAPADQQVATSDIQSFISSLGFKKALPDSKAESKPAPNTDSAEEEVDQDIPEDVASSEATKAAEPLSVLKGNSKLAAKYKSLTLTPPKDRGGLLVEASGSSWWASPVECDDLSQTSVGTSLASGDVVTCFRQYAKTLYESQQKRYEKKFEKSNASDVQWLKKVLTSGTLGDRQAALVLRVQEGALFRLQALESLMNMVRKKGKREALLACDSLFEVFSSGLLPSDRALIPFAQRPWYEVLEEGYFRSSPSKGIDRCVLLWYYEDAVKKAYKEFLARIQELMADPQANIKNKVLNIIFELLRDFPEQEKVLLQLLVSQLGDSERKIASKAGYLLHLLLDKHPDLSFIVIREVEPFLHRPKLKARAKYYALCFLNQMKLRRGDDAEAANKLIQLYFRFFEEQLDLKKDSNENASLVSALLTGVNRAYPYSSIDRAVMDQHANSLFRIVHTSSFNCSVQALNLLFQVMDAHQEMSQRFYRTLYATLFDNRIIASSKHASYLNVLFKAMKIDPDMNRVKAFVKRLLQMAPYLSQGFVCATMVLLVELFKLKPGLRTMLESADLAADSDDEVFQDADKIDEAPRPSEDAAATSGYNPLKREPTYAGAEKEALWEAGMVSKHFSPSVRHFFGQMVNSYAIDYQGDPLQDMTLIKFLDKFIFKTPKKSAIKKSIFAHKPKSAEEKQMSAEEFQGKSLDDVAPDEVFFYHYFQLKKQAPQNKRKSKSNLQDFAGLGLEEEFDDVDFASVFGKGTSTDFDDEEEEEDVSDEEEEEQQSAGAKKIESSAVDLSQFKDSGEVEEHDYSEMDDMDFGDEDMEQEQDNDDEDQLADFGVFEDLSGSDDDSDDDDEEGGAPSKTKGGDVFAAADEFSQLLEDDESGATDRHEVQRLRSKLGLDKRGSKHGGRGRGRGRGRGAKRK